MLVSFDGNPENYGKYFRFTDLSNDKWHPVDMQIIRNGEHTCLKQNVSFGLREDDIIEFGDLFG